MHLVLGYPDDTCCAALVERLTADGHVARLIASPFAPPARLTLRIEPDGATTTALALGDGPAEAIESVFVRGRGGLDPAGWEPGDYAYMQAESQAALLAWLDALECPVVNRLDAELWYRARTTLLHWLGQLRDSGLRIPETIVSDSVEALAAFRGRLESGAVPGAVFKALTREGEWLVGPGEWSGVRALQAHGPVCLAEPHGPVMLLCVVGEGIVWGGEPSAAERALEERLVDFAQGAGLAFVEIALAEVRAGPAVVHIDPQPRLENFAPEVRRRIVDALAELLTGRRAEASMAMPMEALP